MPPHLEPGDRLRFGVFEVNLAAHELRKHGVRVRLSGQPFEILALLLEHPYQIVTRVRLRERLWPADTFVDFEHSLNSAIKKLRDALGDSPENSRYVETLPRVGYRFVAPVERLASDPPSPPAPVGSDRPPQRPGYATAAAFTVLAATVALYSWYSWRSAAVRHALPPGEIVLAVLPFENLSGDPQQEYFSDGLTEEMIQALGRIDPGRMRVIARESVMRYKADRERLDHVARDLGVQYVLVGSVRREADRVRVTAELLEASGRVQLLTRTYDRNLRDILSLQSDVARAIAAEIRSKLDPSPPRAFPGAAASRAHSSALAVRRRLRGVRPLSQGPLLLEQADAPGSRAGDQVFRASRGPGAHLRPRLCRPGRFPRLDERVQPRSASRVRAQGARGGASGPGARRGSRRSPCLACFHCPELRLGLANRGEGIPPRHRARPQLSHRPPLVRRVSRPGGPFPRSVRRNRACAPTRPIVPDHRHRPRRALLPVTAVRPRHRAVSHRARNGARLPACPPLPGLHVCAGGIIPGGAGRHREMAWRRRHPLELDDARLRLRPLEQGRASAFGARKGCKP